MTIYIGADHAGYKMKELLKRRLKQWRHTVIDVGASRLIADDDYPDYGTAVAHAVSRGNGRGILICANGVGMCVVANKVSGVRAALGWSEALARTARADDDTNVLCLPARLLTLDPVESILKMWLKTKFSGAARHKRRLKKVAAFDRRRAA